LRGEFGVKSVDVSTSRDGLGVARHEQNVVEGEREVLYDARRTTPRSCPRSCRAESQGFIGLVGEPRVDALAEREPERDAHRNWKYDLAPLYRTGTVLVVAKMWV